VKLYSSRFLKLLAGCYLAFPVLYLVLASVAFDVPARTILGALLTPSFYLLSALAVLTGWGLRKMKRWAWHLFVFTNVCITYANAIYALEKGQTHHPALSFVLSLVLLALITYRVGNELNVPYLIPKIRWWESDPRHKLIIPVSLKWNRSDVASTPMLRAGEILDIDQSGCFIKLSETIPVDTEIQLTFQAFGAQLSLSGAVVWKTETAVTHPRGVGVKFGALEKDSRKILRGVDRRVRQITRLYRSARYILTEEDYFAKMQDLKTRPMEGLLLSLSNDKAS
jgi:hypothetical protein